MSSSSPAQHHQILIVGGGAAGITVASQLLLARSGLDVAILEPSSDHYYQPGWTLVGGGVMTKEQTRRDEADLIPAGCTWIRAAAASFEPEANRVITSTGEAISYDTLVVATGLQLRWERVKGLEKALGRHGVTSNYSKEHLPYTWETIRGFKGGTAIFTFPETPIKCAGAPQKIMYMADDIFKATSGVGVNTQVIFATAGPGLFGVPVYARVLKKVVEQRGIQVLLRHNLREIRAEEQVAVFEVSDAEGNTSCKEIPFSMIHAVPPMSAPELIAQSPLATSAPGGWVEVDKYSTQHVRYPNVFSLGDVSSLPTSKTAGAVRGEAPVLVANLLAQLDGKPLQARYDGYSVCPLITGYDRVVMAEFDYDLQPVSSFQIDPTRERWSMWLMKTRGLPWIYWNRMLKGQPHESRYLKPFKPLAKALGLAYKGEAVAG
ncbi:NAD(P)/FAD-dependent oxidoreductase [Synechococcus sp. CS-1329]|uniref:NAD(P)/FAD-dependent oxidoreductase n=1 Tax=Synechococcus sp. CS-1329 TaxID=2847975 RepID=UPI00223B03F1|nr:FAD/NAD(P)-binding oxidoreductase [Synechococcus sp. CS-1329]MCT0218170.1 NAD(P)/FAD-dependent oxidoreductase [Synechococcus sp. CS-1329]